VVDRAGSSDGLSWSDLTDQRSTPQAILFSAAWLLTVAQHVAATPATIAQKTNRPITKRRIRLMCVGRLAHGSVRPQPEEFA
jgi:hypothetical protein